MGGIGVRIMDGTVRVLLVADPAENRPDGNRPAADPAENRPDGNRPAVAPAENRPDGSLPVADPAGSPLDGSLPVVDPAGSPLDGSLPVVDHLEKANPEAVPAAITAWDRSPANPAPDKIRGLVILRESGEQSWREDPGGQAERQESPGPPGG